MASLTFILRAENLNGRLRTTLMSEGGAVRRDAQRRGRNVRDRARTLARQRSRRSSGRLPASIRYVTVQRGPDTVATQVGSDLESALWVEEGTGLYGPRHTPIVPVRAKRLVFRPAPGARLIRAKSVKGQPGKHYLRDALPAARL